MEIVFATNNPNKLKEIKALVPKHFKILSLVDIGCNEELPETQDTIEGNALQKANYVKDNYGIACFSDDTGLFVNALNGAPGVYSARYAGPNCSPDDNIDKLLHELDAATDREAHFKTVIAFVSESEPRLFEGRVDGKITTIRSGHKGFGYDPIFTPNGYDVTFAEMSQTEKGRISHRGRAVEKLILHLQLMEG